MLTFLPFYPVISFFILIVFAKRLSWFVSSCLSISAILATFLTALFLSFQLSESTPVITGHLWTWFTLGVSEKVNIRFYFDGLSMR